MSTQSGFSQASSSTSGAGDEWRNDQTQEKGMTEQYKQAAKETASEIKHTAGAMASEARRSLDEVAAETKAQATELAGQLKQQADEKVEGQKIQAAQRLHSVAAALRDTGRKLQEQDEDLFAQYADTLADQVEKASTYLQEMNINDMVRDVQHFAHRKPEMFVLGSLAAGFLLGRFLSSSSPRMDYSDSRYRPSASGYGAASYTNPSQTWSEAYGARTWQDETAAQTWSDEESAARTWPDEYNDTVSVQESQSGYTQSG